MHFVEARGILNGSGSYLGMNIYRGCTHGCIYCDSRSTCYRFTPPSRRASRNSRGGSASRSRPRNRTRPDTRPPSAGGS